MFSVFLINSPIKSDKVLGRFQALRDTLNMVPSGIAFLAAVLEKNGIAVSICDAYALNLSKEEILARIEKENYDLVGIGATTTNINTVLEIVEFIKGKRSVQKIVLGGIHPSAMSNETLKHPGVNFIIREEGEYALLNLCRALESGGDLSEVAGLSYKENGKIIHNEIDLPIQNLDKLPFPSYHLLPMEKYSAPAYMFLRKPVYQIVASRGCPYGCTFCINANKYRAKKYRSRSIDNVIDEILLLKNKYGAREIMFWDPHFPLSKKQALEFAEKMAESGLSKHIVWTSTTRVEIMDKEIAEKLYESGCRVLGFGIESGSEKLLKNVNKVINLEEARKAVRETSKAGIITVGSFMLGLPNETAEDSRRTIEFAKELDLDFAQFSIFIPYPGTPLYESLNKEGKIKNGDWDLFNQSVGLSDKEPPYVPDGYSSKELSLMQRKAYREFYFRGKMFFRHLKNMKSLDTIPIYFNSLRVLLGL